MNKCTLFWGVRSNPYKTVSLNHADKSTLVIDSITMKTPIWLSTLPLVLWMIVYVCGDEDEMFQPGYDDSSGSLHVHLFCLLFYKVLRCPFDDLYIFGQWFFLFFWGHWFLILDCFIYLSIIRCLHLLYIDTLLQLYIFSFISSGVIKWVC